MNKWKQKIYNILRKSEKWTKTDMVYIFKNGLWLNSSKAIAMITSFALALAYANLIDKETYANYKYITSTIALFSILALPGLDTSLFKSMAKGFEGSYKKIVKIKFKVGIILLLIFSLVSTYYFLHNNTALSISFAIAAFLTYLNNAIIYGPYLRSRGKFNILSIYNIIIAFVSCFSIILALLFSKSLIILVTVFYASTILTRLALNFYTFRNVKLNNKEEASTIKYGNHLNFLSLFGTISLNIDKIILWHFLGPIQLAIYSFALMPIKEIQATLDSINIMAMPKLAKQKNNVLRKTIPYKAFILFIITVFITIMYVVLSPLIFRILFPEYVDSIIYTQALALMLPFFVSSIFGSTFVMKEAKRNLYLTRTIPPIISIFLFIILIPAYGIWGAIITKISASLIQTIISVTLFVKNFK